jgi:hypothetical protein
VRLALLLGLIGVAAGTPPPAAAQSSQFGVRGLGHPGRPYTPRARATGGSFALFDGESDFNPAAMANLKSVAAGFVAAPSWRQWESPAGDASLRDTRFPLVYVGGPVPGSRFGIGVSIGSYADRDFRLATADTVVIRGVPVGVNDTLTSLGGLNEIRFAGGYALSRRTTVGAAGYWITGSSRQQARRHFSDTSYVAFQQSAELSYQGYGLAVGVTHLLTPRILVAALLRSDGKATVDLDSTGVYSVDLPYTVSAGAQVQPSPRLTIAAAGTFRSWSGANSDLQAQGGIGARNTLEFGVGGELIRNPQRPGWLPIRLGARYADLPFPIVPGGRPKEWALSVGTGVRFAQERAGVDLALEQVWRSQGAPYKERGLSVVFGLSIRPYGAGGRIP